MTDPSILRQVSLDQLELPSADVRDERSEDSVLDIASSMGDPDIGQQSPISVFLADGADLDEQLDKDALHEEYAEGHPLVIHDGVTRYLAAEQLGWSTIRAEIRQETPENEIMARLSANTDRSDMSDFEVYSALREHYQSTDATLDDIGQKLGQSASLVSRVFSLFEAPEFVFEAWRNTEHPLSTTHAIAVRSLLSDNTVEAYQDAGDLSRSSARSRAEEDARMMVDVQAERELTVSEFRSRCKRLRKQTINSLEDDRDAADKQADGQTQRATAQETPPAGEPVEPCTVCGSDRERERRKAVQVCPNCHGVLSEHEQHGDPLLQTGALGLEQPQTDDEGLIPPTDPHRELFEFLVDVDAQTAAQILESLQQQPQ